MYNCKKSQLFTESCAPISLLWRMYSFYRASFIIVVRLPGHFKLSGAPDS